MNPSACLVVANAGLGPAFLMAGSSVLAFIPIVPVEAVFLRAFLRCPFNRASELSAMLPVPEHKEGGVESHPEQERFRD